MANMANKPDFYRLPDKFIITPLMIEYLEKIQGCNLIEYNFEEFNFTKTGFYSIS